MSELGEGWGRDDVNRWITYHASVSLPLTMQRTALSSALIPITPYILISCVECWRRHPTMVREIAAATPPEELGRAGHTFGTQIDNVHLWSVPNFALIGRKVLATAGMVDAETEVADLAALFDFWARAASAFRFDDGTHQAWDAGGVATPFRAQVGEIVAGCKPVRDEEDRARLSRLNALVTSYLFLLWFDTRSGYQDTGPYQLDDGRVLLLRSFNRLGVSHFPWSNDVSTDMPYDDVLGAFVLEGVKLGVTDFGTSITQPEDYLPHVVEFGLFDVAGGKLAPIDGDGADALAAAAKAAQRALYRRIAAMERNAKIDAGAYVYFTFLRPFADLAGVDLDWTVPRDSLDVYPMPSMLDMSMEPPMTETVDTYYLPVS